MIYNYSKIRIYITNLKIKELIKIMHKNNHFKKINLCRVMLHKNMKFIQQIIFIDLNSINN